MWAKILLLVTASSYAAAFGLSGGATFGFPRANQKGISLKSTAAVAVQYSPSKFEKYGLMNLEASMATASKKSNPLQHMIKSSVSLFLVCLWITAVPNFCAADSAEPSAGTLGQVIFDTRCLKCHAGHSIKPTGTTLPG